MLRCQKCGRENPDASNFCSNCGAPLTNRRAAEAGASGDTTRIIPVITDDVAVVDELSSTDQKTVAELPPGSALLVVRRASLDERFLLNQPTTEAGRSPRADVFLDDITVSRHHAEFVLSESGVLSVRDLGSLNGTYVNRALVDGVVELRTGDEVQIGKYRMLVFVGGPGTR